MTTTNPPSMPSSSVVLGLAATPSVAGTSNMSGTVPITQVVPKPKIGDLTSFLSVNGTYTYTPWTGGIPSTNWDLTASALPETPFCYCLLNTTDQLKIHTAITKGLSKKFGFANGTYSLLAFESGVWKHLRDTGMDLVFYFLDGNTGTMQNIVNWHLMFLLANIREIVCDKKVIGAPYKYDTYDLRNLTCSQTFLLSSLTDNLLHAVEQKITNETSGPEIWMYIVDKTQLDSARRHQRIRDLICGLHLTDFPGENVRLFNQKMFVNVL